MIVFVCLNSFLAVEEMRKGNSPSQSAKTAIDRIIRKHPNFFGGVIAVDKSGGYGAACRGMEKFPFSVANNLSESVKIVYVDCEM